MLRGIPCPSPWGRLVALLLDVEREEDGLWLAEIPELPGVLAYGATSAEAIARTQALALRVLADRVEHGERVPAGVIGLFAVPA